MSKTFKQQPKQPKPIREATQRYKREKQQQPVREWKSSGSRARMALGERRLNFG
jgi:UDP-N-acetylenolpyruvoylglucosamine reductase